MLPPAVSTSPRFETLNGLSVQRYSFTQDDLVAPNIVFEQAEGDLWVATAGNYVIQYVISATLRMMAPIPNAHIMDEGTLILRYTLTDINADFTITPPDSNIASTSPLATFPRLPDAEITAVFPAFIEYTSAISPVSATLFYRDELTALDWTEESTTVFAEKAHLTFSKEDQTATIIINPFKGGEKIKVTVNLDTRP
jgi:hypothetical protein